MEFSTDSIIERLSDSDFKRLADNPSIDIKRPVLDEATFDTRFGSKYVDLSMTARFKKYSNSVRQNPGAYLKQCGLTCLPPIQWLQDYQWRKDIWTDLLAGFIVGIMNVPQGMAYGILAGLPAQYGLYTSLFPPILYSLFGTSKHISYGPFAVISLMVSAVLDKNMANSQTESNSTGILFISNFTSTNLGGVFHCERSKQPFESDSQERLEIAFAFTFIVGICQIIFGLLNVGFISVYLSDQLVEGLTAGAAVQVMTSQVGKLFGIRGLPSCSGIFGIVQFYVCFFANIVRIHWASFITSVICLTILFVSKQFFEPPFKKRVKIPFPTELFLVIFGTLASHFAYLHDIYDVQIIGAIPTGIPAPKIPMFSRMMQLLPDAITMSLVGYSISVSMGKLFAKKHDYKIKPNQEWFASGFVHVISSFFTCHCSGSSLSRSAVQESQGSKSHISSVVGALIVLIVVLALAPLLKDLPLCILATIIIVNLKNTFNQFGKLPRLWKQSKIDFLIWIVACISTILLDTSFGLMVGIMFAILTILFRAQWPDSICLGRIHGTELYKGSNACDTEEIPYIKIYRFDSPLYFANAALFKEELYRCTNIDPLEQKKLMLKQFKFMLENLADNSNDVIGPSGLKKRSVVQLCRTVSRSNFFMNTTSYEMPFGLRCIIIDCSSSPYMDLMGVDALKQVYEEFRAIGVQVAFASVKVAVRQLFAACDFYNTIPKSLFYLSVHDAVVAYSTCQSNSASVSNMDL